MSMVRLCSCRSNKTAIGVNCFVEREDLFCFYEERSAMFMVTVDKNKCDGAGTFVNVCPQSVFKLEGGKAEPVNMSECINCLTCVENCPQQAITVTEI